MPAPQQLQRLRRIQETAQGPLFALVEEARKKVARAIREKADKPNDLLKLRGREQLFSDIVGFHEELGAALDKWAKDLVETTSLAWDQTGRADAKAEPDKALRAEIPRFDRERAKRYFELINPDNAEHIGAVFTKQMSKAEIAALRTSVVEAFRQQAIEGLTATQTSQRIAAKWRELAGDIGTAAFKDKGGQPWENARYLQMLTRTIAARVARESYLDTITSHGDEYARIQAVGDNCPVCTAWNGLVISISGRDTTLPSYEQAIAAGMFHPNCDCVVERIPSTQVGDIERQRAQKNPPAWDNPEAIREYKAGFEAKQVEEIKPAAPQAQKEAARKILKPAEQRKGGAPADPEPDLWKAAEERAAKAPPQRLQEPDKRTTEEKALDWVARWSWSKAEIEMPSKEITDYLGQFKPNLSVTLYRAERKDHDPAKAAQKIPLQSWTGSRALAKAIADTETEKGIPHIVRKQTFTPAQIFSDLRKVPNADAVDEVIVYTAEADRKAKLDAEFKARVKAQKAAWEAGRPERERKKAERAQKKAEADARRAEKAAAKARRDAFNAAPADEQQRILREGNERINKMREEAAAIRKQAEDLKQAREKLEAAAAKIPPKFATGEERKAILAEVEKLNPKTKSAEQRESTLRDKAITPGSTKELGGGINLSFTAKLEDGTKVVVKPADDPGNSFDEKPRKWMAGTKGEQMRAEAAAWQVAKTLGFTDIVQPTVIRTMPETTIVVEGIKTKQSGEASIQEFKHGAVTGGDRRAVPIDPAKARRLAVFDMIIGNSDRHSGNWMVTTDGSPVAIDHGLAFTPYKLRDDGIKSGNSAFRSWNRPIFKTSRTRLESQQMSRIEAKALHKQLTEGGAVKAKLGEIADRAKLSRGQKEALVARYETIVSLLETADTNGLQAVFDDNNADW